MIPFSPPYIDEDIVEEVKDTLASGWITTGPKVRAFEALLKDYVEAPQVLCVNSATSGLMLMLHWYGVGRGDEVIVPAYTYSATALAVLHVGATPVMVDVLDDFSIDPQAIESAITSKTKAIIPVDFAGWPCDYQSLHDVCSKPAVKAMFQASDHPAQQQLGRILILSDAAHSIGAQYHGKRTGSLTDITVFSFHAVKNVTAAEGGAICLNLPAPFDNEAIFKFLKKISLNGQTKDALAKNEGGSWRYDIDYAGFKMNMPDLGAAIGMAQLKKYESYMLPRRQEIYQLYERHLRQYSWLELPPYKDHQRASSCHLYPVRIKDVDESRRDQIIAELFNLGVSVNVHFIPMPMLSLFKSKGYRIDDYPNSFKLYSQEISLPVYPQLSNEQVETICNALEQAYQSNNVAKSS